LINLGQRDEPSNHTSTYNPSVFGDCSNNFPFYYNPSPTISPAIQIENNASTFTFFDSPADACIHDPSGHDSMVYTNRADVRALCNNMTEDGAQIFTTTLVGVNANKEAIPLPFAFTWDDTFNGWFGAPGLGGITIEAAPGTLIPVDPESGTGGITILSVNDIPASSVPEPSSVAVLIPAVLMIWVARKRKNFRRV
jgi:hypothetical protein